jgi:glycosyltransferase involved in cell wall biosynthesis
MLFYKTWGLWRVCRELRCCANRGAVQYILSYGNTGFEDIAYLKTARAIGAQFLLEVCDLHSIALSGNSRGLTKQKERVKHWFNLFKDRHVVPQVDGLLVISYYLREYYSKCLARERILLTPILGDKEEFEVAETSTKSGTTQLLWLGTFRPFEGLEFLVDALTELDRLGSEFHCSIFAVSQKHAAFARHIQARIQERGLSGHVTLNKQVPKPELIRVLRDADIVLLPRQDSELNRSNFPTKMVDYLFAGKPIVSSRVGEIPLYCEDGVQIVYPADSSPLAFAIAIQELIKDPQRAIGLGRQARQLAEEVFDYRRVAPRIRDFLRQLPTAGRMACG